MKNKICKRCIMDISDKDISFDEDGYCNHCINYFSKLKNFKKVQNQFPLQSIVKEIKKNSNKNKYDCIVGLSGGFDSSYMVYKLKKLGLNCLVIHFDNHWDTAQAARNIKLILDITKFDYINYQVDWLEFRNLQKSYMLASVIDVEIPTDYAVFSLIPKYAIEYNIKFYFHGNNFLTESIMPKKWNYSKKRNLKNLINIHKKFLNTKLTTYPIFDKNLENKYRKLNIKQINFYDHFKYDYNKILRELESIGWKNYSIKHGESGFTKFYQNYYLIRKFGIDKRRAHISNLICSGMITRKDGLAKIKEKLFENEIKENNEIQYILDKLDLSKKQFFKLIKKKEISHKSYGE